MFKNIVVTYDKIDDTNTMLHCLDLMQDTFACDFETASKYSNTALSIINEKRPDLVHVIKSNGLSHPKLASITHLSFSCSKSHGFVVICHKPSIRKAVYEYLVETTKTTIWFNASFDLKHILYNTGKLPKSFKDNYLMYRCLNNYCNALDSKADLKHLMRCYYGQWAEVKESAFEKESIWNTDLIKYAATDACATYLLYKILVGEEQW